MCKNMQYLCIFILLLAGRTGWATESDSDVPPPQEQDVEEAGTGQLSPDEQETEEEDLEPPPVDEEKPKIKGPDWIIMLSPSAGWIKNKVTTKFTIPRQEGDETVKVTLEDDGWGPGLVAVGIYKWLVLVNVLYFFPDVNYSRVIGGLSHLSATIPTPIFIKPYLAAGFFYQVSKTNITNYVDSMDSNTSDGTLTTGYGYFDEINVDVRILNPFPEVGAKFMIPIQHWYITPYYSFWYDDVKTRAKSPGGRVFVYERGHPKPESEPSLDYVDPSYAMDPFTVDAFDKKLHRVHMSHLVGAWINIDLYYFLQLQTNLYYNINDNLFSARLIGSFLFSKYVGLTAYFEYQDLKMVDNIFFFIGPCFVFFPPGWFDSLMAMKDKKTSN